MYYDNVKLPSFMRKRYLNEMYKKGNLHFIYSCGKIAGFYCLENEKFKCSYINPLYRRNHLATRTIVKVMKKQTITIAVVSKNCPMRSLIKKLGFSFTGLIVQGKQSKLEIWKS